MSYHDVTLESLVELEHRLFDTLYLKPGAVTDGAVAKLHADVQLAVRTHPDAILQRRMVQYVYRLRQDVVMDYDVEVIYV